MGCGTGSSETNSMPEWICPKCHTTNFVKKHVCRGCAHAKGWLLPPKGDPLQGPAQAVSTLLNHPAAHPPSHAVPAGGGGKHVWVPPAGPMKHSGVPSGAGPATTFDTPASYKAEETKLLKLKQQLMEAHLCTVEIDNRLDALRAARAPVVKPPAQALVLANTQKSHHRPRETAEHSSVVLQKQLAEALQQLEESHVDEAAAAAEVEAARKRAADAPSAPQLPVAVLQNTAKNLHCQGDCAAKTAAA